MRFTAALLATGLVAACAAPAIAGDEKPSSDMRLPACEAITDMPSKDQIRACTDEAVRFVQAHRDMIETAQHEIYANRATIEDARDEIRANAQAIREAAQDIRESAEELREAARALREERSDHRSPPNDGSPK